MTILHRIFIVPQKKRKIKLKTPQLNYFNILNTNNLTGKILKSDQRLIKPKKIYGKISQRTNNRPFQRTNNRPFQRTNNRPFQRTNNRPFQRMKKFFRTKRLKIFIQTPRNKPLKLRRLAKRYLLLIKSIKLTKAYKLIKFREVFRANELSSQFYVKTKFYKKNRLRRLVNLCIRFKKLNKIKFLKLARSKLNKLARLLRWHILISRPMQPRSKQIMTSLSLNLYKLLRLYSPYKKLIQRGRLFKLNAKKNRFKSQLLKLNWAEPTPLKKEPTAAIVKKRADSLKTLHTKINRNIAKISTLAGPMLWHKLAELYTDEDFLLNTIRKTPLKVTPKKSKPDVCNNKLLISANKVPTPVIVDEFANELSEVRKMLAFERPWRAWIPNPIWKKLTYKERTAHKAELDRRNALRR